MCCVHLAVLGTGTIVASKQFKITAPNEGNLGAATFGAGYVTTSGDRVLRERLRDLSCGFPARN